MTSMKVLLFTIFALFLFGCDGDDDKGGVDCDPGDQITATILVPDTFPNEGIPSGHELEGDTWYTIGVAFYSEKKTMPSIPCVDMPSSVGDLSFDLVLSPGTPYQFMAPTQGPKEADMWPDGNLGGEYYVGVALWLTEESFPIYMEWAWLSDKSYDLKAGCNIDLGEIELSRNADVHHTLHKTKYCVD